MVVFSLTLYLHNKGKNVKYLVIVSIAFLSACSVTPDQQVAGNLESERDFHAHQQYVESIYNLDNYDPEYVEDCLFYTEVVCEFE